MSDAAIASIVTGLVTIATLVVGFLTLWVKLKYGVEKSLTTAANVATSAVSKAQAQIADVNAKANIIVKQTNGTADKMRDLVQSISERVSQIETYHHDSTHRLANTLNVLNLKVTALIEKYHPDLKETTPPELKDNR